MDREMESLALPELLEIALARLDSARDAVTEVAARINPPLRPRPSSRPRGSQPPAEPNEDVVRDAPSWLRPHYRRFREEILGLDPGITSRPAPIRDGKRRYEGFAFAGKNIIYVNLRKSMILVDFDLPQQAGYQQARVRHGSGRQWFALPINSEGDFDTALELARLTVTRARGGQA